jgi:hypothetical protein
MSSFICSSTCRSKQNNWIAKGFWFQPLKKLIDAVEEEVQIQLEALPTERN